MSKRREPEPDVLVYRPSLPDPDPNGPSPLLELIGDVKPLIIRELPERSARALAVANQEMNKRVGEIILEQIRAKFKAFLKAKETFQGEGVLNQDIFTQLGLEYSLSPEFIMQEVVDDAPIWLVPRATFITALHFMTVHDYVGTINATLQDKLNVRNKIKRFGAFATEQVTTGRWSTPGRAVPFEKLLTAFIGKQQEAFQYRDSVYFDLVGIFNAVLFTSFKSRGEFYWHLVPWLSTIARVQHEAADYYRHLHLTIEKKREIGRDLVSFADTYSRLFPMEKPEIQNSFRTLSRNWPVPENIAILFRYYNAQIQMDRARGLPIPLIDYAPGSRWELADFPFNFHLMYWPSSQRFWAAIDTLSKATSYLAEIPESWPPIRGVTDAKHVYLNMDSSYAIDLSIGGKTRDYETLLPFLKAAWVPNTPEYAFLEKALLIPMSQRILASHRTMWADPAAKARYYTSLEREMLHRVHYVFDFVPSIYCGRIAELLRGRVPKLTLLRLQYRCDLFAYEVLTGRDPKALFRGPDSGPFGTYTQQYVNGAGQRVEHVVPMPTFVNMEAEAEFKAQNAAALLDKVIHDTDNATV